MSATTQTTKQVATQVAAQGGGSAEATKETTTGANMGADVGAEGATGAVGFEKLFERLDALEKRLAAIAEREEPKGKGEGSAGARAIAGSRGATEPPARTLGEVRERMSRKYELASDW